MTELQEAVTLANKVLDRHGADPDDDLAILSRNFLRALESLTTSIEFGCNAKEALRSALKIIDEIDEYQNKPERGEWGVECACCMGELFDKSERAVINNARCLVDREKPDLSAEREIISNVIVPPAPDGRLDRGNR